AWAIIRIRCTRTRSRVGHIRDLVRVQRIRIIAQAGDGNAVLADQVADMAYPVFVQLGHIDMGHARIPAIGGAGRPAHYLDAAKPLVRGESEHVVEIQVEKEGTDESELHGGSPFARYGRSLTS